MSTLEKIDSAIAYGRKALEFDNTACMTSEPTFFLHAKANYETAITHLASPLAHETNTGIRSLLRAKMSYFVARRGLMQTWLHAYGAAGGDAGEAEMKDLAAILGRLDVVRAADTGRCVGWADVKGVTEAKRGVEMWMEEGCVGGVLLYGPCGSGKTLLARAVAARMGRRLCVVCARELIRECEKGGMGGVEEVVRGMFGAARGAGGVVIVLDDVDLLYAHARLQTVRHAVLRCLQTLRTQANDHVSVVATTREPWALDAAFTKFLRTHLRMRMPTAEERTQVLHMLLREVRHELTHSEMRDIASECDGYTGADMEVLVRDAAMEPVRMLVNARYFRKMGVCVGGGGVCVERMGVCDEGDDGCVRGTYAQFELGEVYVPPVNCLDFELALHSMRPCVAADVLERYVQFERGG